VFGDIVAPGRPGVLAEVVADVAADLVAIEEAFADGNVMSGGTKSSSNLSATAGATLRTKVARTILIIVGSLLISSRSFMGYVFHCSSFH
jgi:hypothetical protein